MCCQLGDLWVDGDFESRQELQKLVFPNGILLDKENGNYRTISLSKLVCSLPWREIVGTANKNENEVFKIMRLFSSNYKNEKEKATTENARLSPCVGMRRLERPTPTSRT